MEETFDPEQDLTIFDPIETWKKTTLKGGTYEQYQTYTLHLIRTPSLSGLAAADSVSGLTLSPTYDRATDTYNVVTSQDQVKITPTALCSGTAITVAGKSTQSGSPVTVNLADCKQDSGKKG